MPAKLVDCPCKDCKGSGTTDCGRCSGSGRVIWGTCWGCRGSGKVICLTCGGRKQSTFRTWVPDTLEETMALVEDLEAAVKGNENGWILVNALRRGYRYTPNAMRGALFPQDVIERIVALEKALPEPCSHCRGQGSSEFSNGEKCGYCSGSGCAGTKV